MVWIVNRRIMIFMSYLSQTVCISKIRKELGKYTMTENRLYSLDGKIKITEGLPFAIQQVLSMFLANITPAVLITAVAVYNGESLSNIDMAIILQNSMIVAGIGTLIQGLSLFNIGAGLPIIMGLSFSFLAISMVIAAVDYGYLMGAVLVGGIFEGVIGLFYKYWKRFISPLTSGCVVIAIGFSIIGSACSSIASSNKYVSGSIENIIIAMITMLVAISLFLKGKGMVKQLYLLIALCVGYIISIPFGMVDFKSIGTTVSQLGYVSFPHILQYKPKFELKYIIAFIIIYLTSAAETVGDISALTSGTLDRFPTEKELKGGLACDGFVSAIAGGLFGCMPITSFSGQIGTVIMTKIVNRRCAILEGIILIIAGFIPAIGAIFTSVPSCVLGGVSVIAFGAILTSGFSMIAKEGFDERNSLIVAVSLTIGIGSTLCPEFYKLMPEIVQNIFAYNPIAGVFVWTVVLSAIFKKGKDNTCNEGK